MKVEITSVFPRGGRHFLLTPERAWGHEGEGLLAPCASAGEIRGGLEERLKRFMERPIRLAKGAPPMRSMSRILLGAFLAFSLSNVAVAETSATQASDFTHTAQLRLDQQFELSVADVGAGQLWRLGGPSRMSCSHAVNRTELETCVVTTEGTPRPAVPAAIAANN